MELDIKYSTFIKIISLFSLTIFTTLLRGMEAPPKSYVYPPPIIEAKKLEVEQKSREFIKARAFFNDMLGLSSDASIIEYESVVRKNFDRIRRNNEPWLFLLVRSYMREINGAYRDFLSASYELARANLDYICLLALQRPATSKPGLSDFLNRIDKYYTRIKSDIEQQIKFFASKKIEEIFLYKAETSANVFSFFIENRSSLFAAEFSNRIETVLKELERTQQANNKHEKEEKGTESQLYAENDELSVLKAVEIGNLEAIKNLIEQGRPVNAKDDAGDSPLVRALASNRLNL